jgi:hypothetical protein
VLGQTGSTRFLYDRVAAGIGLGTEEYGAQLQHLSFRRGFLLTPASADARVDELVDLPAWRKEAIGHSTLRLHPDTLCTVVRSEDVDLALLGEAFDPADPGASQTAVAQRLHGAVRRDADLYDLLDKLAGRFRLVVARGGRTVVRHDAMGSASVFYAESGAGCASHSALLARLLGAPMRDFVVPFILSPNYQRRDVKYLPGAVSPFEGIVQLTPNTELHVEDARVVRYWPREPVPACTPAAAAAVLEDYLRGMGSWLRAHGRRPLVGLTGGTDSRGLLVACADLAPTLFTYVRSSTGEASRSRDSQVAGRLAALLGLPLHIIRVKDKSTLADATSPEDEAYRLATGYVRGASVSWVGRVHTDLPFEPAHLYVRGFGGEVLRGFYQTHPTRSTRPTPNQLARTYDVNAGSAVTRGAFDHFVAVTGLAEACAMNVDVNDLLYWEHRMGVWGSSAMSEADLAMHNIVGYNSRTLYTAFLGLDYADRSDRRLIHSVFAKVRPDLTQDLTADAH